MTILNRTSSQKSAYKDIAQVHKVLAETGAVMDTKLLSLIDEAEQGDYHVMRQLWDLFVYGYGNSKPNYKLAERYWLALHDQALMSCEPSHIAQTKADYAFMQHKFQKPLAEVQKCILEAIQYMVTEVEPQWWDSEKLAQLHGTLAEIMAKTDRT